MSNLVWNAVRFTSSGQVVVSVACEVRDAHHAEMRVSVTDSGMGFSQETIRSLFEKSSHGPVWASKIRGGAGIGLIVSKKVIELMGGWLHVESQVGQGSKFCFTLPLAVEDTSV
jgi:signal transduction histidine kinase